MDPIKARDYAMSMIQKSIHGLKRPHKVPPYLHRQIVDQWIDNHYQELVIDSEELKQRASHLWAFDEDTSHLGPELKEELVPLKEDDSAVFKPGRTSGRSYNFKKPFVSIIEDITIAGQYAVAQTSDGKFVADTITYDPYNTAYESRRMCKAIRSAIQSSDPFLFRSLQDRQISAKNSVKLAAVLHRPRPNYYHWMLEHVLKLRGVEQVEAMIGEKVALILPPNPPEFVKESIELLGFSDNPVIKWEQDPISVKELVVPSFPEPTPGTLTWLRDTITEKVNSNNRDGQWIYISRQNTSRGRRVFNFSEIRPVLDRNNIKEIYCEDLTLKEQVRLFASVDGIIGPHGAGLTNMVYAKDISVIELFNGYVRMPYYVLSSLCNHEYVSYSGKPVHEVNKKERDLDFVADPDELELLIERVNS